MQAFTFVRVQAGYWGSTKLTKTIKVWAENAQAAQMIANTRKDARKGLKNGDYLRWELVDNAQ